MTVGSIPTLPFMTRDKKSYVAGFFDGEGNVSLQIMEHSSMDIGYKMQPICGVTQRGKREELRELYVSYCEDIGCSCGVSYNEKNKKLDMRLYGFDNVATFLESLIPHLIIKKREAKIMLNDIIPLLKSGMHKNKVGFMEIMELKEELDETKSVASDTLRKYDCEYFEDIWDVNQDQGRLSSW